MKFSLNSTNLQILNFLDELNILLRQALLVRGDVYDSAVQLFDLDVELADVNLKLLNGLRVHMLLLGHVLHLGQQLVNLGLEFGLLLLRPDDKENHDAITRNITRWIFDNVRKRKICRIAFRFNRIASYSIKQMQIDV